ncbi:MAG TPA: PilZ domain-containing protein [Nitrospira sp.]|nr:PilZ domain-containing protein [Nitrospira sp.]
MTFRSHRKFQRFAIQLPCALGDLTHRTDGTVINLSRQGCAVMTAQPPSVSSHLALWIDLLDDASPIEIELAGVRWISDERCGFEFIRITPEMLIRLGSFVSVLEHTP